MYRRGIGDVLRASMLSKILKSMRKDSLIDAFVRTPVSAEILRNDPNIDRILIYDTYARPSERAKILFELLMTKYNLAIVCFPSGLLSNLVALLSGAQRRIGFVRDRLSKYFKPLLLTDIPAITGEKHELVRNLELLKPLGYSYTDSDKRMILYLSEKDYSEAEGFFVSRNLENFSFVVGMAPGSSGGQLEKRWPIERYAEVSDWIKENYNAEVLVFESGTDATESRSLQEMAELSRRGFVRAGGLSLGVAAALMKKCRILVCNDNGGMHMAAAVQAPVIAIFGPSDQDTARPLGTKSELIQSLHLDCCPCWAPEMGSINCSNAERLKCIDDIQAHVVIERIRAMISEAA